MTQRLTAADIAAEILDRPPWSEMDEMIRRLTFFSWAGRESLPCELPPNFPGTGFDSFDVRLRDWWDGPFE